tara:strand:+ start:7969 stop:8841 length:873 start_codon:yes stop_codon:yes gene_type:complete
MWRFLKALYLLINVVIILTLLILHFYIKDSSYKASLFFYMFPLPIIISVVLGLSIFLGKKRKYNLILAGLLLIVWLGRSFRVSFSQDIKDGDLEVVFWNTSRNNGFETAFNENKNIPDVLVLTESNEFDMEILHTKYPDFYFYKSDSELRVFSKTPIDIIKEEASNFNSNIVNFKTMGLNFFAVDINGSYDVPWAREFAFFNSLNKNKQHTIILGDFNVPVESLLLKDLKKDYRFYFSSKGNGFRETWFWSIPFLSLDQIWVSKDLKIVTSEKIRTSLSDHSMIKTVIRK